MYTILHIRISVNIMFIIELPNECKIVRIVHMCINPKPIFTLRQKRLYYLFFFPMIS